MRSPRPQTKPADTLHILRLTLLRQTRSTPEPASHRLSNVVGGGGGGVACCPFRESQIPAYWWLRLSGL